MIDKIPLTLSKTAFAARCGIGASTVSQWIARGHISGDALTADGRINVAEAERQLGRRLDLSRSVGKMVARGERAPRSPNAGPETAPEPTPLSEMAVIKLEQARRQLQRDRDSDLERQGLYVRTADMRRAHARELSQFITTVEQRLPELVALLAGHDQRQGVVISRRWWRSLRQAEADAAGERAAVAPELVVDNSADLGR